MAAPSERDLVRLGPFVRGINNLAEETSVPRGAARSAVNVDIADSGKVRRRAGYERRIEADEPESLFGYGPRGFYLEGQNLMGFEVIDGSETAPLTLYTGLRPYARLAHCLIEPDIYVSDGVVALRITPSNDVSLWSIPAAPTPALQPLPTGALPPGRYHVAVALKSSTGEEGPLSSLATIDLASAGGIRLEIPSSTYRTAVYMTKPDGTELLLVVTIPTGATVLNISKQMLGRPPVSQDTDPMPAGRFAAVWRSRLLVADDRFVHWSLPNQFALTNLGYDYLEFVEQTTMLAAPETAGGFFVGQQSRTYFISGDDPADFRITEAYPFGVIPGTMTMVPGARLPFENPPAVTVPLWMASNGVFCVGMPDGTVAPLTETNFAASSGSEGAALFDQRGGVNRFVATLRNPTENAFAFSDQVTAEVVRNGIPT